MDALLDSVVCTIDECQYIFAGVYLYVKNSTPYVSILHFIQVDQWEKVMGEKKIELGPLILETRPLLCNY